MLSKVLFLWNSTCQLSCLIVLWCWSMGPLFSVPPAFWKILGFCCIASKLSAVVSKTNHSQTRSPCQMQLQRRSRDSCFPYILCTLFPKFLPNQLAVLIRNPCAILACILLATRNPAAAECSHLENSLEIRCKPWGAGAPDLCLVASFVKPAPGWWLLSISWLSRHV